MLPFDSPTELLRQQPNEARTNSFDFDGWTSGAVISDEQRQFGVVPENDFDLSRPGIPECVLERIGHELIDDKTQWNSLVGGQIDLCRLDAHGDRPHIAERICQVTAQLLEVASHFDPAFVLDGLEVFVRARDRLHTSNSLFERLTCFDVRLQTRLHGKQGCNHHQIVLRAMSEFSQQQIFRLLRRGGSLPRRSQCSTHDRETNGYGRKPCKRQDIWAWENDCSAGSDEHIEQDRAQGSRKQSGGAIEQNRRDEHAGEKDVEAEQSISVSQAKQQNEAEADEYRRDCEPNQGGVWPSRQETQDVLHAPQRFVTKPSCIKEGIDRSG